MNRIEFDDGGIQLEDGRYLPPESAEDDAGLGQFRAELERAALLPAKVRPVGLAAHWPPEALRAALRRPPAPGSATPPGGGLRGV